MAAKKKPPKDRRPAKATKKPPDTPSPQTAAPEVEALQRKEPGFAVVGIGASAGGLDAFKKFFSKMPPQSGIAFILVPHLDPTHESFMAELLGRFTAMPVTQATQGETVQPNHVYVIPPNRNMIIAEGVLRLTEMPARHAAQTSLDVFMRSLAQDQQEKAICIILSGTGSHGTLGLKAIKDQGGMAMVQDPKTAEYPQMPESAIATDLVDYVLAPEQMPEALVKYTQHFYFNGGPPEREQEFQGHVSQILALLRARTKYDFRCYRPRMLIRRIQRRMGLSHFEEMADYLSYLRENADEVRHLAKDLLISVTSFFREPEAFQALERDVVPEIIRGKDGDNSVRVWVPGCATGEEAYSLAILFLEQAAAQQKDCTVRIFATDVDSDALEAARNGIYPESIAADVSAERLRRFFQHTGQHFHVNKILRESVIFAVQNVISDPPFSHLDLISCRNLFIYLEPESQQRVMSIMEFALQPGGFVFLGPAESIGEHQELFAPVSKKWRIYRQIGPPRREHIPMPRLLLNRPQPHPHRRTASEPPAARPPGWAEIMHNILLTEFGPAAVLINRKFEVLYFHGPTMRYLEHPPGRPTNDLLLLARDSLRGKLRAAVRKALTEGRRVTVGGLRLHRDGMQHSVQITTVPVPAASDVEGLVVVTFMDEQQLAPSEGAAEVREEPLVSQLEDALKVAREDLQGTIEELESSNEELRASHEEAMSMNEELQSTNEELETSKEELQSLNEELSTVNDQLQGKVEELERANNDFVNVLTTTDIALLFLDSEFRIKRYTSGATELFSLIGSDTGRLLSDIAMKFTDPDLLPDSETALERLTAVEKEVRSHAGRWYLRRIVPYRTIDKRIDGVVITLADVTHLRDAAEKKAMEKAVVEAGIKEQRRIGQDLHDGVGQELTAMALSAQNLAESLAEQKLPEAAAASKIVLSLQTALGHVRNISRGLFPVAAEPGGLMGALQLLADHTSAAGSRVTFETEAPVLLDDNDIATHLYRVAQEALTNALRHARAKHIRIRLGEDNDQLTLAIADDGNGIADDAMDKGVGLRIMAYRAGSIGATLDVRKGPKGGTVIECKLPKERGRAK